MCVIITSIWCLWFEMKLILENEYEKEIDAITCICNNDSDVNIELKTTINSNITQYDMAHQLFKYKLTIRSVFQSSIAATVLINQQCCVKQ